MTLLMLINDSSKSSSLELNLPFFSKSFSFYLSLDPIYMGNYSSNFSTYKLFISIYNDFDNLLFLLIGRLN